MRKIDLTFFLAAVVLFGISLLNVIETPERLHVLHIHPQTRNDIVPVTIPYVVPVLYDSLLIDAFSPIDERKQQFINQVLPAILIAQYELEHKSRKVKSIINKIENQSNLSAKEKAFADSLVITYRAKSYDNLLVRMKPHPTSLVLAQAIIESGWGMSRFATEGNNLFGVWTEADDKQMLKSRYKRGEQEIFLKRYTSIAESVSHYYLTIGRHNAYRNFRQKRYTSEDVFSLIELLDKYSEEGDVYTSMLKKIIEWNNLLQYDECQIDPSYLIGGSFFKVWINKAKTYFTDNKIKFNENINQIDSTKNEDNI